MQARKSSQGTVRKTLKHEVSPDDFPYCTVSVHKGEVWHHKYMHDLFDGM